MLYRHEQMKCPHVRRETQWGDAAKNLRRRADAKQAVAVLKLETSMPVRKAGSRKDGTNNKKEKEMKSALGVLMIVSGFVFDVYVGVWWAFIDGIMDVIYEIRAINMDVEVLAVGIAKILFAAPIGWIAAMTLMVPGLAIAK
jgi:hypothetical protein